MTDGTSLTPDLLMSPLELESLSKVCDKILTIDANNIECPKNKEDEIILDNYMKVVESVSDLLNYVIFD